MNIQYEMIPWTIGALIFLIVGSWCVGKELRAGHEEILILASFIVGPPLVFFMLFLLKLFGVQPNTGC